MAVPVGEGRGGREQEGVERQEEEAELMKVLTFRAASLAASGRLYCSTTASEDCPNRHRVSSRA